jgi:ERCC4-type nuclease
VNTEKRALPCGDYGVTHDGRLLAAVERKSLADLVSSLLNGKLRFALGELSALPRAAVVVEDRFARVFQLEHVRPAVVADGLAELQVMMPTVPIVFCDSRPLAEEWTYRYLAAAATWADSEESAAGRVSGSTDETVDAPAAPTPTTKELRTWARSAGLDVPDRGRLRPEVLKAWSDARATAE